MKTNNLWLLFILHLLPNKVDPFLRVLFQPPRGPQYSLWVSILNLVPILNLDDKNQVS
jgi:hypothetical protein